MVPEWDTKKWVLGMDAIYWLLAFWIVCLGFIVYAIICDC